MVFIEEDVSIRWIITICLYLHSTKFIPFWECPFRWAKYHDIKNASFVHDTTLLYGGDNTLTFLNLNDGSSATHSMTGSLGNGVTCYVGHKLYDIFAFSGACVNPKITLYSYPEFKLVSGFQSENGVRNVTTARLSVLATIFFFLFCWQERTVHRTWQWNSQKRNTWLLWLVCRSTNWRFGTGVHRSC